MKIPSKFKLYGHEILVENRSDLSVTNDNTGEAHYRLNKILLQPKEGYTGRPKSKIEQDFCHELMHFIMFYGECKETEGMYRNEFIINRLSLLLHQALSTMEY